MPLARVSLSARTRSRHNGDIDGTVLHKCCTVVQHSTVPHQDSCGSVLSHQHLCANQTMRTRNRLPHAEPAVDHHVDSDEPDLVEPGAQANRGHLDAAYEQIGTAHCLNDVLANG